MNLLAFTSSKDTAKGEEWSPISLLLHNLKKEFCVLLWEALRKQKWLNICNWYFFQQDTVWCNCISSENAAVDLKDPYFPF